MASITLENGAVVTLSMTEVRELLGTVNVARPGMLEAVEEIVAETPKKQRKQSAPAENSAAEDETLHCVVCENDFTRKVTRGRKPNMCPSCKSDGNSDGAEDDSPVAEDNSVADEQPKPQRRSNNGGGRKGKRDFSAWLAEHEDDPMTPGMEKSIRWMLTSRQVGDTNRAKIVKALDANPRINCNAAHKIINYLHPLPKVEKV